MSQIFISYSRKDIDFVDQLTSRLNAAGYELWIDRLGIRGGEQWRREIVDAIGGANVLILVLSRNSAKSDNVRKELDLAEGEKKRILPIVIQSVTIPAEMKYQLAGLQLTDFTADFETGFNQLLEALTELVGPPKPVAATPAPAAAVQHPRQSWLAANKKVSILVGGQIHGRMSNCDGTMSSLVHPPPII